jgi:hypothetical protein
VTRYDEERLGRLLRLLPPVPDGWVLAAQELPGARRSLDEIVARSVEDAAFRKAVIADLEAALEHEGLEPEPRLVEELRRRISES